MSNFEEVSLPDSKTYEKDVFYRGQDGMALVYG